jgi:hypothetical protein
MHGGSSQFSLFHQAMTTVFNQKENSWWKSMATSKLFCLWVRKADVTSFQYMGNSLAIAKMA